MQRVLSLIREDVPQPEPGKPVWCLGRRYENPAGGWSAEFVADASARVWLMYRTQFATPIPRHPDGPSPLAQNVAAFFRAQPSMQSAATMMDASAFTSDVGWGCMIRTGQSLLANALEIAAYGRDVRPSAEDEAALLRKFSDDPAAQYSIHQFVEYGAAKCGKLPGQWFGPSAVARCIAQFANMRVYRSVAMDVYEPDVLDGEFPVLVLCGLRLGIHEVNPVYYDGLRSLLSAPQAVGIAGGRTSASHYFYGFQGERLFFHDPHEPKVALTTDAPAAEFVESMHSQRIRALPFSEMDPSMLAGFLLTSAEDYAAWKEHMNSVPVRSRAVNIMEDLPCADVSSLCDEQGPEMDVGLGDERGPEVEGFVMCENPQAEDAVLVEDAKRQATEPLRDLANEFSARTRNEGTPGAPDPATTTTTPEAPLAEGSTEETAEATTETVPATTARAAAAPTAEDSTEAPTAPTAGASTKPPLAEASTELPSAGASTNPPSASTKAALDGAQAEA